MTGSDALDLLYVLGFAAVTTAVLAVVLGLSRMLRPSRPDDVKGTPYECGMDQMTRPWGRFHVRYYYFGLLFVLFDIETVLLFAVATRFRAMAADWVLVVSEVGVFVALLLLALVYAWRKGALEWQ